MKTQYLKLSLLLIMLGGLVACSGSNNLKDPTNSAVTVSSCDPTQVGCVLGQFADEVVANLDYSCGNVRSVTDSNGFFTCPSNTVATFFIGVPDTKNQVILGSATIAPKNIPVGSSGQTTTSGIVEITPLDLVPGNTAADPTSNNQVLNVIRFLKAIDTDGRYWNAADYSGFNGSNRIVISDQVRGLTKTYLTASIPAADFSGSDLSDALKAFVAQVQTDAIQPVPVAQVHPGIPDATKAQKQFQDFLKGASAGVYFSSGTTCANDPVNNSSFYDLGMCNNATDPSSLKSGDLVMFIDRTGYGYGIGVTSTNKNIVAWDDTVQPNLGPAYPYYIVGTAANEPLTRPIDYTNNNFNMTATADPQNTVTTGAGSTTGPSGQLGWKGIVKAGSIASTPSNYKLIYNGAQLPSTNPLGVWTFTSPSSPATNVTAGQFFLYNAKPANPFLNAAVYDALTYPINLKLTFKYHDASCTTATTDLNAFYCNLLDINGSTGTAGISILKNGNIITNINDDCNVIAPDPIDHNVSPQVLKDGSGQTEYRIGFVSTVTGDNKLSLTFMFPKIDDSNYLLKNFQNLKGTVGGVVSTDLITLPTSGASAFTLTASDGALWNNYFKSILGLVTKTSATANTPPADAQGLLLISKATQSCP